MKRLSKWILFGVGAVIVAGVLVYEAGWLLSFRLGNRTTIPEAVTLPVSPAPEVGAPVTGELKFDLPLCRSVTGASVEAGKGSIAAGSVRIEPGSWKFLRRSWRLVFDLRALHAGNIAPGTLKLELSGENAETVVRRIPGFSAVIPKNVSSGKLTLAGAIEIPKNPPWVWITGGAVLVLCVIAVIVFAVCRRRRPEPTLWERTEEALRKLRAGLASGGVSPEQGYIDLTDLVRGYLEARYGIPASTRTTPEFLADVNGPSSPLPKPERPFLREFLEAADKVKFAALTPDAELLQRAVDSAARLVRETRPAEPGAGAEKRGAK